MDHDDDVEHLFSWLQTPDLRYREFAGAREITDSVVIIQQRATSPAVPGDAAVHPPRHDAKLEEEYPANRYPDQGETRLQVLPRPDLTAPIIAPTAPRVAETVVVREETRVVVREEATIATREVLVARPASPADQPIVDQPIINQQVVDQPVAGPAGPFALGASGRNAVLLPRLEEPVAPPPVLQTPAPRQAAAPPPPMPPPVPPLPLPVPPASSVPPTRPEAAPAGGLLGGAYREDGLNGHGAEPSAAVPPAPPADGQQRNERSLDAVFGRLAGARERLADPRDRLRHIPGLRPPANRPR